MWWAISLLSSWTKCLLLFSCTLRLDKSCGIKISVYYVTCLLRLTILTAIHSLVFSCLLTVNSFAGFDFVCSPWSVWQHQQNNKNWNNNKIMKSCSILCLLMGIPFLCLIFIIKLPTIIRFRQWLEQCPWCSLIGFWSLIGKNSPPLLETE